MSPIFGRGGGDEERGERSAEDREAAWRERMRRRGASDEDLGEPSWLADPTAGTGAGVGEVVTGAPAAGDQAGPAGEPRSTPDPGPAPESDPGPAPDPDPDPDPEPAPAPDPDPASAPDPAPDPAPLPGRDPDERPVGTRRGGRPLPAGSDLPTVAAAAGGRPRLIARGARRPRYLRRALLIVPLVLLLAIAWTAVQIFQPFHGEGHGTIRVFVPNGATVSQIGDLLEKRGVVESARWFGVRARLSDKRSKLRAGAFFLRKEMSYGAAIAALTDAPIAPKTLKIVIPEGLSIREARPIVRDAGVRGPYRRAAIPRKRDPLLGRLGAPASLRTLEGLLFPATYELPATGTATQLVDRQLVAFRRTFDPTRLQARRSCAGQRLTPYEVVIVASMVEREASLAAERPKIASVICNRLRLGMPLGIDATIRYKVRNWSRPLTKSELAIDSAFNTRTHKGLPPTPIGSPGASALRASLRPARTKFLYYVVKPCGNGAHAFSTDEAGFQRDVDAYNKKREQLGGKDPSRC